MGNRGDTFTYIGDRGKMNILVKNESYIGKIGDGYVGVTEVSYIVKEVTTTLRLMSWTVTTYP